MSAYHQLVLTELCRSVVPTLISNSPCWVVDFQFFQVVQDLSSPANSQNFSSGLIDLLFIWTCVTNIFSSLTQSVFVPQSLLRTFQEEQMEGTKSTFPGFQDVS